MSGLLRDIFVLALSLRDKGPIPLTVQGFFIEELPEAEVPPRTVSHVALRTGTKVEKSRSKTQIVCSAFHL